LAGFKRKLDRHLKDKRVYIYISYSVLPRYRQLDDLDPLTHQVQVQVQLIRRRHVRYYTSRVPRPPQKSRVFIFKIPKTRKVLKSEFGPGNSWKLNVEVPECPGIYTWPDMHLAEFGLLLAETMSFWGTVCCRQRTRSTPRVWRASTRISTASASIHR